VKVFTSARCDKVEVRRILVVPVIGEIPALIDDTLRCEPYPANIIASVL